MSTQNSNKKLLNDINGLMKLWALFNQYRTYLLRLD